MELLIGMLTKTIVFAEKPVKNTAKDPEVLVLRSGLFFGKKNRGSCWMLLRSLNRVRYLPNITRI